MNEIIVSDTVLQMPFNFIFQKVPVTTAFFLPFYIEKNSNSSNDLNLLFVRSF